MHIFIDLFIGIFTNLSKGQAFSTREAVKISNIPCLPSGQLQMTSVVSWSARGSLRRAASRAAGRRAFPACAEAIPGPLLSLEIRHRECREGDELANSERVDQRTHLTDRKMSWIRTCRYPLDREAS